MKLKTKKSASKRFKITKNNKIIRASQMANHLMRKKSKSQARRIKSTKLVSNADKKRIKRLLPFN